MININTSGMTFDQVLAQVPHSVTFVIDGVERTREISEADRISGARELLARDRDKIEKASRMTKAKLRAIYKAWVNEEAESNDVIEALGKFLRD